MPRYAVKLEYRGVPFHGFQKQPGLMTVQGSLEKAITTFSGEEVRTFGSGRTDTGVHAVGQVVAFDLRQDVDIERAMRSLNALLPSGVAVTRMIDAPTEFDPRREAVWRQYRYFIFNRNVSSPVFEEFSYHVPGILDWESIKKASVMIEGKHDFSAFSLKGEDKTTVRTVSSCGIGETFPGLWWLSVRADSFLYRMVRILMGAVIAVGTGRMGLDDFEGHLAGGDKPCTDPLPPNGLFLWQVAYPQERISI